MISREHARTMAANNRWMNERLYELCAGLSDSARKRDRAALDRMIEDWTTLRSQLGVDAGVTDLPWLPALTSGRGSSSPAP